jgi:hypothetical protein
MVLSNGLIFPLKSNENVSLNFYNNKCLHLKNEKKMNYLDSWIWAKSSPFFLFVIWDYDRNFLQTNLYEISYNPHATYKSGMCTLNM